MNIRTLLCSSIYIFLSFKQFKVIIILILLKKYCYLYSGRLDKQSWVFLTDFKKTGAARFVPFFLSFNVCTSTTSPLCDQFTICVLITIGYTTIVHQGKYEGANKESLGTESLFVLNVQKCAPDTIKNQLCVQRSSALRVLFVTFYLSLLAMRAINIQAKILKGITSH